MTISDPRLDKAISDKDVLLIRTIILNHIDIDVNRKEFMSKQHSENAAAGLKDLNIKLFEKDNGDFEFPSEEKWNKELWQTLKVEMRDNFSRKKFDFILDMMNSLRKKGDSYFQIKETNFTRNEKTESGSKNDSKNKTSANKDTDKVIATCSLGTVAAVTGFCIAKAITSSKILWGISSVVGGGIGCLAGLIYLTMNKGGKK